MSANDLLTFFTQLLFILLGFVTALDYLRQRDRVRRDIALMFDSLAVQLLISLVVRISGIQATWLSILGSIILIAQPYLLLRLVQYFRPVSNTLLRLAVIGMVTAWIGFALSQSLSDAGKIVPVLAIIVYFVAIDGYAAIAFVRGAVTTTGVVRQRLRFAAAGSALLALALVSIGLIAAIPALRELFISLTLTSAIASALSYYIGFASPRWLRRAWQLGELRNFLLLMSRKPVGERMNVTQILMELCQGANLTVGGMGAAVAQLNVADNTTVLSYVRNNAALINYRADAEGVIGRVWREQMPMHVHIADTLGDKDRHLLETVGADTLLLTPIVTVGRVWGVLLVFLKHSSLFLEDDLELLTLLAQQSAIFLENVSLIEELQRYSQELERRVDERTRELSDSQEQYRRIVETAQEGIWVTDTENKTLFANPRLAEMLGYPIEEILGVSGLTFMDEETQALAKVKREQRNQGIQEQYELRLRRKDGTSIYTLISATPLVDERGKPIGSLAMLADITARKQMEEHLRQSETALKQAQRVAHVGSWTWHIPSNRLEWSDEMYRIFGIDIENFGGDLSETVNRVIHPDDRAAVESANRSVIEGKKPVPLEYRVVWPDGTVHVVWAEAGQLMLDAAGSPAILTGIAQDITERKQTEEAIRTLNTQLEQRVVERTAQLEAANKELEAFSYSVSHDLRAPLRSIDGFSQALLEDYAGHLNNEGQSYLQRVRAAAQRMAELIDDLLKLSQITRAELKREPVDLAQLGQSIAVDLQKSQPERQVNFVFHEKLMASGDPYLLRIVLENLLGNAWKFTSKKHQARIEMGLILQEAQCIYFVRDDGSGFDMTYADKLFGAFQRLHNVTEFEGTGIGLATVQRIVHRHGGRVWAEATVGEGATFYFTL